MRQKAALLLSLSPFLFLSGCCSPMKCRPALDGFAASDELNRLLSEHYSRQGSYPASLSELRLSASLSNSSQQSGKSFDGSTYFFNDSKGEKQSINFEQLDKGLHYKLRFEYTGPGKNICTYYSKTMDIREQQAGKWGCVGYY